MTTVFGIKACDTMKKAFTWLDGHGVAYDFHDFKKQGVARQSLEKWCDACGWEKVINRAGTSFRKLSDADKLDLDREKAITLMMATPSLVKRPVLEHDGGIEIGFKPERYGQLFPR
ncbi:MAG: arsenate reductase [Magnetospirillum gryphiswaldense]|nr:arsenate reductase [Magnetospirillum gryphiswaldense]